MSSDTATYRICVTIPRDRPRDAAFAWIWNHLEEFGLLGIHEGTAIAENWTVDSAQAPEGRDWVGSGSSPEAELYFSSELGAKEALRLLREAGLKSGPLEKQDAQDWDAEWKASFLGGEDGVVIPPFWRVVPPWLPEEHASFKHPGEIALKINPGAGFGTGTHETTQLCLRELGELRSELSGAALLDFGSGSGILSIAGAKLGARSWGVEIDPLALDNARENAALNCVENLCVFSDALARAGSGGLATFKVVVANILRPVLIEFAPELIKRVEKGGTLVLSGLIENDVASVLERYQPSLRSKPRIHELGEWRSIAWRA